MPGGDGTGPMGQGPMTGKGNGYCVVPGEVSPRFGRGRRRGLFAGGGGRGFGRFWTAAASQDEKTFLREEASVVQNELEAINKRLRELEK